MVAVPTAADLKTRYPEFTGVSDELINMLIPEALTYVDDDWVTTDQKPAILAFTAHQLSLEGYPKRTLNPGGFNPGTSGRQILSRKVGDVSTTYAQSSGTGGDGAGSSLLTSLGNTVYGQRFAQLLALNVPAIGLV